MIKHSDSEYLDITTNIQHIQCKNETADVSVGDDKFKSVIHTGDLFNVMGLKTYLAILNAQHYLLKPDEVYMYWINGGNKIS